MKVKDLKKLLADCNDNDLVILSKDGEGNSFSPLCDIEKYTYLPETTWIGSIYIKELTPDLRQAGYEEEDLCPEPENGVPAIVLWPTN